MDTRKLASLLATDLAIALMHTLLGSQLAWRNVSECAVEILAAKPTPAQALRAEQALLWASQNDADLAPSFILS